MNRMGESTEALSHGQQPDYWQEGMQWAAQQ